MNWQIALFQRPDTRPFRQHFQPAFPAACLNSFPPMGETEAVPVPAAPSRSLSPSCDRPSGTGETVHRISVPHTCMRSDHPCRSVLWLVLLAFSLAGVWSSPAWGRAGGGEHFGGGGGGGGGFSGGGGGFSGSGGGFSGGYHPGIHYGSRPGSSGTETPVSPLLLIIIAIIVLIVISNAMQAARQQHIGGTVRRNRQRQNEQVRQQALQAIKTRDPSFDLNAFLERVETAFLKIQSAWSEQDLTQVRSFISDGVHERFSLQIDMMKATGQRNVMADVRIISREDAALFSSGQFDSIHVRFIASATDYQADLKSGRKINGTEHTGEFAEYWSFHRRSGTKSPPRAGAIEGNCPRCGSPLQIVDRAVCSACGAQVNSGEYDWVLAEITQDSEFHIPGSEVDLPGVQALTQRDPGFSILHIEDRVSVMFWRMRASEFYENISDAAPVLTPAFKTEVEQNLARQRRYWKDAAVGQVELLQAQSQPGQDDLLQVKVRASGVLMDRSSSRPQVLKDQSIYTQVYTLLRQRDVQTNLAGTFTSAGCAQCGAPLSVDQSGACSYCGTIVTDGRTDWVLNGIDRFTSEMAGQHYATLREQRASRPGAVSVNKSDPALALAILAQAALVDGVLEEKERQALISLGAHRGLTPEQVDQILQQARTSSTQLPMPTDSNQAREFLDQLIHVFLTDGQLSGPERNLLKDYALSVGLTGMVLQQAINREQQRLMRAARDN